MLLRLDGHRARRRRRVRLALTERVDGDEVTYLVDVGSEAGADVLAAVPNRAASRAEIDCARADVGTRRSTWAAGCRRRTCGTC